MDGATRSATRTKHLLRSGHGEVAAHTDARELSRLEPLAEYGGER